MGGEQEGVGSTFHFTITVEKTASPEPGTVPRGVRPSLDGERLLIVDDNAANREILVRQAESWGCARRHPRAEALAWIRRGERFDIAILDMQMPEMDGFTWRSNRGKERPRPDSGSRGRPTASTNTGHQAAWRTTVRFAAVGESSPGIAELEEDVQGWRSRGLPDAGGATSTNGGAHGHRYLRGV